MQHLFTSCLEQVFVILFHVKLTPLCCFAGVWSELPVASLLASTMQVKAGEDAILQCPLMNGSYGVPSILSWYRQAAGRRPELLLSLRTSYSSDVRFGSGFGPDKVAAGANGSLLLSTPQLSDTAVYYCSLTHQDTWGGWTTKGQPRGMVGR